MRNLISSIFISIITSVFTLVLAIPYVSSQEDFDNSQVEQLEKQFNQLSPEHKTMIQSMIQGAAKKSLLEASPEEQESIIQQMKQNLKEASPEAQESIIQQMKQMFPPQLLEKILPDEKK